MPKLRTKRAMVGWFDPIQLIQTGIRVMISTVFGEFADKREAFAGANPISDERLDPKFNYSGSEHRAGFGFDYVADTGDGWNPTFAVARLLAEPELQPAGAAEPLARGQVLIMGGDQVYPTATRKDYDERLLDPYEEAWSPAEGKAKWDESARPDLFAVPGNHDWYDGLKIFFHLFCRRTIKEKGRTGVDRPGRLIGGRQTHQTRSYFALKLPHGWWLWGTDSQLEGYIDQPQIDFFQFVAEKWMAPGSKLILCTGTPDWEYVDPDKPEGGFTTFSYLERLAPAAGKGHRVKLVLSGDSHHYARFQEDGLNYITCGGGGAFLHPTHNLEREKSFLFPFPPPGERAERGKTYPRLFKLMKKGGDADGKDEALFPSRADSARLSWGFPAFALRNPGLTLTLAGLYFFFTWLLDFHSRLSEHKPLVSALGSAASLREAACLYWQIASFSPWPILLSVLSWAGYYYFADFTATVRRVLVGGAHALLQAVTVTLVTCLLIRWVGSPDGHPLEMAAALVAASIGAALASSTLMGLYLWFCISVWGAHWGHFSALAVEDYKSFLRLRIDEKGVLHVFPIGLRKVPDDRGRRSGEPAALHSELIEPPILIG